MKLLLRRSALCAIAVMVTLTGCNQAESPTPVDSSSPQSYYQTVLDSVYSAEMPGATVVVSRQNEVIFSGAVGMADMEMAVPLSEQSVMRLASVTKQYTAAAILKLVEEGQLALDDTLAKFWPDSRYTDVTIHQLLNHSSGIPSYTNIPGYVTGDPMRRHATTEELLETFMELEPDFPAGSAFRYNNSGYVLLGAIIEQLSGQAWDEYIAESLLAPVGIEQTRYFPADSILRHRARGYQVDTDQGVVNAPWISLSQPHAAGALKATALAVDQWQRALHQGELLQPESYAAMIREDAVSGQYGYGLMTSSLAGMPMISHDGGIHGFNTSAVWLPDSQVSVVVLSNFAGHQPMPATLAYRLAAHAAGQPFPIEKERIELPLATLERYHGTYQINANTQRTLTVRDGQLYSQRQGGTASRAHAISETTFVLENSLAYFTLVLDDNGSVTGVNFFQVNSATPEFAQRVSDQVSTRQRAELSVAQLERLLGAYELQPGFVITLRLEGSQLLAQATGQGAFPVYPESETRVYNAEIGIEMEFTLPAEGPATSLTLFQSGLEIPAPRVAE